MDFRPKSLRYLMMAATLAIWSLTAARAEEPSSPAAVVFDDESVPALADGDLAPQTEGLAAENASSDEASLKSPADPEARIRELERKLDALLKKSEKSAQSASKDEGKGAGKEAKPATVKTELKPEDVWADTSTEKWTVKLGGHVQTDYINWASSPPSIPDASDYFEFRRLRLVADGTGYGIYDFRLQMTLEPETVGESSGTATSPDVKDAYFTMNEIPYLGRFRIGNFFVPFSLEQVTNDTNNIFMERSIPTQGVFAADREVGVAVYNQSEDQKWTWAAGCFFDNINDTLKERIDDNQGYRASGRLTYLPYYDEPSNGRYLVHTGVGILHTQDQDERVRFRSRPQIHEGPRIIDSGNLSAQSFTTGNVELAVVNGPVTIQSEAFLSSVNLYLDSPQMIGGAYVHGSWFLTGENRIYERFGQHGAQFGRNVPYTNFFLTKGGCGWGAWEAKARWSNLTLTNLNSGQYNDVTVGMNWYWSDRTRVMFDWIHPVTSAQTIYGETTSDILAMRFDFNW